MSKQSGRGVYPSYYFKDHDPVIDHIMTLIKAMDVDFATVAQQSHVSIGCLRNWAKRKTKRPLHCTVAAVVFALGHPEVLAASPVMSGRSNLVPFPKQKRAR